MDGTIIGQGSFLQPATAVAQIIQIPSNVDSLEVWNYTQANQSTAAGANGYHFFWQRGNGSNLMGDGTQGIVDIAGAAGAVTVNVTASGSFILYDPSTVVAGAKNNGSTGVSALTAANPAVATVGSTAGLSAGSVIRFDTLAGVKQGIFNGIDFSVGYGTLNSTHFSVDYLNSTGSTTGTGNWRIVPSNPSFYPRRRTITNISAANPAVITLSVDHGFTVGQEVRLSLPGGSAVWGTYAALSNYGGYGNGQAMSVTPNSYIITAVDTATGNGHNTITINANTSGFGSFLTQWESITPPYTPAQVIPIGEDTATALAQMPPLSELADATYNTGYLGMVLAAGATAPAGIAADTVFWVARKATYGGL